MLLKGWAKSIWLRSIVCYLAAQYIRFVHVTGTWEIIGFEKPAKLVQEGKPFIVAFWHGRLLMLPCTWQSSRPLHLLISRHTDGELISRTVAHLGLRSVRGSTNKRGAQAIRTLVRNLRSGQWAGISPDGPHGPRMRASDGIVQIARMAEVPIFPLAYSANRAKILNTWDHFILPFPFSRGIFIWGESIEPPANSSQNTIEGIRKKIEANLTALSDEADHRCGRITIKPAPKNLPRGY